MAGRTRATSFFRRASSGLMHGKCASRLAFKFHKHWILMLLSATLVVPAWAQQPAHDMRERAYELRRVFADADDFDFGVSTKLERSTDEVIHEVELCLTQKCDLFELRGNGEAGELTTLMDFVLIYSLYASRYGDLSAQEGGRVPPIDFILEEAARGPDLLEAYGEGCPDGSVAERASCVMGSLIDGHGIDLYFVNQDLGFRVVYPRAGFADRITVESIEEHKRWIESFAR